MQKRLISLALITLTSTLTLGLFTSPPKSQAQPVVISTTIRGLDTKVYIPEKTLTVENAIRVTSDPIVVVPPKTVKPETAKPKVSQRIVGHEIIVNTLLSLGNGDSEVQAALGLCQRESGFDINARSKSGKYLGLFQLDKSMCGELWNDPVWNTTRANTYVKARYGSWSKALAHRYKYGWY